MPRAVSCLILKAVKVLVCAFYEIPKVIPRRTIICEREGYMLGSEVGGSAGEHVVLAVSHALNIFENGNPKSECKKRSPKM